MPEKSAKKPLQRILSILFGLSFLGSMGFGVFSLFANPVEPQEAATSNETGEIDPQLKALQEKEKGYQRVLEREPDNKFALQSLAATRLQMQDHQGAIEPIEKLLELEPENPLLLQELVDTRLKMKDYQGAIKPIEKLIQLYPEQASLKELLAQIQQKANS